jgi:biopolymer transport protein ExbB
MNIGLILSVISGSLVIVFTSLKIKKIQSVDPNTVNLFEIWTFGLLALLFGFMGQVIGMANMFDAIELSGEITPTAVADGIKQAMWNTVTGLLISIISVILWGIVNGIKKSKINSWKE